ncbi:MAG: hypothetical protein ACHP8A_19810, partial [Terriglobales bacterium]
LLNVADLFARGGFAWCDVRHDFLVTTVGLSGGLCLADFALTLKNAIEREMDKERTNTANLKKIWTFVSRFEAAGVSFRKEQSETNSALIIQEFTHSIADTVKSLKDGSLLDKVTKEGLVVIIDEADRASDDLRLGSFLKNLTEFLARERLNNVLFVVSGLPSARKILSDDHESSLRLFQECMLKPLSPKETAEVIDRGLKESAEKSGTVLAITPEAQGLVYTFSEGYPHFVQQIGYSVFDVNSDATIDEADVRRGVFDSGGAIELIGNRYYVKPFYEDIKVQSQREILTIMADLNWNDWVTKADIATDFSGKDTSLRDGLHALKEKGTIIPRDGFKGQYRLQWASFAFWIKTHNKEAGRR